VPGLTPPNAWRLPAANASHLVRWHFAAAHAIPVGDKLPLPRAGRDAPATSRYASFIACGPRALCIVYDDAGDRASSSAPSAVIAHRGRIRRASRGAARASCTLACQQQTTPSICAKIIIIFGDVAKRVYAWLMAAARHVCCAPLQAAGRLLPLSGVAAAA